MDKLLSALVVAVLLQLPVMAQQQINTDGIVWKLSGPLRKQAVQQTGLQTYIISTTDSVSLRRLLQLFYKEISVVNINIPSHAAVIKCKAAFVFTQLIHQPEILFIDAYVKPQTEIGIIGYDRSFHGINAVDYNIPGADGKNIVVGVKDKKWKQQTLMFINGSSLLHLLPAQ